MVSTTSSVLQRASDKPRQWQGASHIRRLHESSLSSATLTSLAANSPARHLRCQRGRFSRACQSSINFHMLRKWRKYVACPRGCSTAEPPGIWVKGFSSSPRGHYWRHLVVPSSIWLFSCWLHYEALDAWLVCGRSEVCVRTISNTLHSPSQTKTIFPYRSYLRRPPVGWFRDEVWTYV